METNAIIDPKTETAPAPTPSEVMYAKPEDKQVETKAAVETTQEKSTEAQSDQKQGESKEEVKLELKLPEESHLTQAEVDEIASFAKEQGLSQEAAQKLLDREHSAIGKYKDTQLQQFEQLGQEWRKAVESDPAIGGDNLKATAENAKRALDKFAPESLKKFLNESPYGNHPDLVRLFANIGKAMQDDKMVLAGSQSQPTRTPVEILYDKS